MDANNDIKKESVSFYEDFMEVDVKKENETILFSEDFKDFEVKHEPISFLDEPDKIYQTEGHLFAVKREVVPHFFLVILCFETFSNFWM